jgi:putative PIN family toxin of toxin-antitoxin system
LAAAQESAILLVSVETWAELTDVLLRPKFNRYLSTSVRLQTLVDFRLTVKLIEVTARVAECRHPKDDKFLELALSGHADLILTGDNDLLVLHPWREIAILTPHQYLALGAGDDLP